MARDAGEMYCASVKLHRLSKLEWLLRLVGSLAVNELKVLGFEDVENKSEKLSNGIRCPLPFSMK